MSSRGPVKKRTRLKTKVTEVIEILDDRSDEDIVQQNGGAIEEEEQEVEEEIEEAATVVNRRTTLKTKIAVPEKLVEGNSRLSKAGDLNGWATAAEKPAGNGGGKVGTGLAALFGQPAGGKPKAKLKAAAAAAGGTNRKRTAAGVTNKDGQQQQQQQQLDDALGAHKSEDLLAATAATATVQPTQLWTEKHQPSCEADLVIHKKKVQEVKDWLLQQLHLINSGFRGRTSRVLLLSGPPGCGKSTLLSVLCQTVGFALTEWQPPVPTLWDEHQYQKQAGGRYESKLEAFEEFVLRSKMPALSLASSSRRPPDSAPSQQQQPLSNRSPPTTAAAAAVESDSRNSRKLPKLVLIDDLPHAAGVDQRKRLSAALSDLAATARFPIVLCVTEASSKARQEKGVGAGIGPGGIQSDVLAALEVAQPVAVALNPVTSLNVAKAVDRVLDLERHSLPSTKVKEIAEQAEGDLHNALATLQFICTGIKSLPADMAPPQKKARKARGTAAASKPSKKQQQQLEDADPTITTAPGGGFSAKDTSLSLYHALGKLLYNKRLQDEPPNHGSGPIWSSRQPMENDPEQVLAAAGLEASSITAFLHENIPDFVDDKAILDLAGCMHYLSDADVLYNNIRYGSGGVAGELMSDDTPTGSSTLLDAIAASIAARGVCYSNNHPAPRKFHPLKAPTAFAAGRAAEANKGQLEMALLHSSSVCGSRSAVSVYAGEVLPCLRLMHSMSHTAGNWADSQYYARMLPGKWTRLWNGQLYEQAGGGPERSSGGVGGGRFVVQHFDRNIEGGQMQQQQQEDGGVIDEDEIESWVGE